MIRKRDGMISLKYMLRALHIFQKKSYLYNNDHFFEFSDKWLIKYVYVLQYYYDKAINYFLPSYWFVWF